MTDNTVSQLRKTTTHSTTMENYFKIVYRTAAFALEEAVRNPQSSDKWLLIWALDVVNETVEAKFAVSPYEETVEIGDVLWGCAASAMLLDMAQSELLSDEGIIVEVEEVDGLLEAAADYADLVKKTVRDHRKEPHQLELLRYKLRTVVAIIQKVYDAQESLRLVDEKLKKRYPNGYTAEASINRVI